MRSEKTYIAGKVTGQPDDITRRNFKRGEMLCFNNTFDVVNPLNHVPEGSTPLEAMKICIPLLLECDSILLLNDYTFSEGAQIELMLARYCNLNIYTEDDLI